MEERISEGALEASDLMQAVEKYSREHSELADALRIFGEAQLQIERINNAMVHGAVVVSESSVDLI